MAGGGLHPSAERCQPEALRCAEAANPLRCTNFGFPLHMPPCVRR